MQAQGRNISGEGRSAWVEEEGRREQNCKAELQSRQQEILSSFATTIAKSFLGSYLPVTQNCIVVNELFLIPQ